MNMAYGFPDPMVIPCPFCDKEIGVLYLPSCRAPKKSTWGGQAAMVKTRNQEYIVQKDCPHCGKTMDEIQKALDHEQAEKNKYAGGAFQKYSFTKGLKNRQVVIWQNSMKMGISKGRVS